MTRFITISAPVVPLLYSGTERVVWRITEELEQAFDTREEHPGWYEKPLAELNRTVEFLRIINWSTSGPVEATVEIDGWRGELLAGLDAELVSQRGYRDPNAGNNPELQEEATRDTAIIEEFLADLPEIEDEGEPPIEHDNRAYLAKGETAERAIVLQLIRDDHAERWTRVEVEREASDIEPEKIAEAIENLRAEGVVYTEGQLVWACRCAFHLAELGMVTI